MGRQSREKRERRLASANGEALGAKHRRPTSDAHAASERRLREIVDAMKPAVRATLAKGMALADAAEELIARATADPRWRGEGGQFVEGAVIIAMDEVLGEQRESGS